MTKPIKVGDHIAVWWATGTRLGDKNIARVLEVLPYRGPYNGQGPYADTGLHVIYILRLTAPNTKRGYLDMSVLIGAVPTVIKLEKITA